MIKLTGSDGDSLFFSPEHITSVYDGGLYTSVCSGEEGAHQVKESPEEVTRKILEYKLAMARYGIRFEQSTGATNELVALIKLAGLED